MLNWSPFLSSQRFFIFHLWVVLLHQSIFILKRAFKHLFEDLLQFDKKQIHSRPIQAVVLLLLSFSLSLSFFLVIYSVFPDHLSSALVPLFSMTSVILSWHPYIPFEDDLSVKTCSQPQRSWQRPALSVHSTQLYFEIHHVSSCELSEGSDMLCWRLRRDELVPGCPGTMSSCPP